MAAKDQRTSKRRKGPGRPSASEAASRRSSSSELLENALTLFSTRGYDGVSTSEIAKMSGLAQSMIHYHFGTKLDVWKAAITHNMKQRGQRMELNAPELVDLDPRSRLKVIVRKFLIVSARDTRFTRLVMIEGIAPSERLDWLCDQYLREGFEVFADCVRAGHCLRAIQGAAGPCPREPHHVPVLATVQRPPRHQEPVRRRHERPRRDQDDAGCRMRDDLRRHLQDPRFLTPPPAIAPCSPFGRRTVTPMRRWPATR